MILGDQAKQILYKTIEEIGKETIQADISSNINSSQRYIDIIMSRCITRLTSELEGNVNEITAVTLGEALLHYMLTISTLPSERKVSVRDGLTLDIVIPNMAVLRRDPNRSVIIQFIKDKRADLKNVTELEVLQPNTENIWLVSSRPLSIPKYIGYSIYPNHVSHRYSNIIVNTVKFLRDVKDTSFRFIP